MDNGVRWAKGRESMLGLSGGAGKEEAGKGSIKGFFWICPF